MGRAGRAAFKLFQQRWGQVEKITLLCGGGNNGGDGFVVAMLAQEAGYQVELFYLCDPDKLRGDARLAYELAQQSGVMPCAYQQQEFSGDVIIDAMLGTGLKGEVSGLWQQAIEQVNGSGKPVLAIDIPSGLSGDTGAVMGCAIQADMTISFIGLKQGMYTANGPQQCGEVIFDHLALPVDVYKTRQPSSYLIDPSQLLSQIKSRKLNSHKGDYGRLLIIGGDDHMGGAVMMAAEAALRVGAGLITVVTRSRHCAPLLSRLPEVMTVAMDDPDEISEISERSDLILIGPGLGQSRWSEMMFNYAIAANKPLVIDADGLNLLSLRPQSWDNWILTPHPGEAARLLKQTIETVQADRFAALTQIQQNYGGTVVLKGSGTLIGATDGSLSVAGVGNPAMASAGMGDILAGVIAALAVQGYSHKLAANLAVSIHGLAGDKLAAQNGELGLRATDLIPEIRQQLNQNQI